MSIGPSDLSELTEPLSISERHKAKLFDWLMTQFQLHSPHMDGTGFFRLPGHVLTRYRVRYVEEAIVNAYNEYQKEKAKR